MQKGENIKRLRREANADVLIEDFVAGSGERVMSVVMHRDTPHHTSTSGGDALVAVFDSFCELGRECLTSHNSSEEADTHTTGSEGDAQMSCNHIHDDEEAEIRLLIDSSREFSIDLSHLKALYFHIPRFNFHSRSRFPTLQKLDLLLAKMEPQSNQQSMKPEPPSVCCRTQSCQVVHGLATK